MRCSSGLKVDSELLISVMYQISHGLHMRIKIGWKHLWAVELLLWPTSAGLPAFAKASMRQFISKRLVALQGCRCQLLPHLWDLCFCVFLLCWWGLRWPASLPILPVSIIFYPLCNNAVTMLSMLHTATSAILCMSRHVLKRPSKLSKQRRSLLRLAIGLFLPINPPARGTMMSSRTKGQDQELSGFKQSQAIGKFCDFVCQHTSPTSTGSYGAFCISTRCSPGLVLSKH